MALHVFNTRTHQLEPFMPADPHVVRIYTCGLTVYSAMHIGHARTYCFWDVFRRWLEYRGYHVLSVINYTDIDDRIMAKATGPEGAGGWLDVAEGVIATFRRDCRALRIKDYAVYTRATDFVDAQIAMVKRLVASGHAYVVDGEVFYDVQSFPRYGELSGNTLDGQQAGASGRVGEDAARKKHPADFTLWKPSGEGQPSWPTGEPLWPQGRPGWHIECSAMSTVLLGDHFDVHGGAIDNLFPHHENEVAQSEPLCGHPWVGYWMHPEHLDLRGVKMSKSLGNVIGIPELLAEHSYDAIRWFFASTHYRTKLAFSDDLVAASARGLEKVLRAVRIMADRLRESPVDARRIPVAARYASLRAPEQAIPRERESFEYGAHGAASRAFIDRFIAAMDEDLACPRASAALFDYVNELFAAGIEQSTDAPSVMAAYRCLTRHLHVLGMELADAELYPELAADSMPIVAAADATAPYRAVIDRMLELRAEARKAKDFARSDTIRDLLKAAGVTVEDTPRGARWELP
ncbi:MAG TPA: cysteine--tRNA ligase [Nannocystaceae bacterium]|nr:cysteine--tRNA ligase [Nannocystaceae bacterium]